MLKGRSIGTEFFAGGTAKQNMRAGLSAAKGGEQRRRNNLPQIGCGRVVSEPSPLVLQ